MFTRRTLLDTCALKGAVPMFDSALLTLTVLPHDSVDWGVLPRAVGGPALP